MLQLKKGLDAVFECVYSKDPAIEGTSAEDLVAFHETGNWDCLTMKNGVKPAIFKIRGLPRQIFQETLNGLQSEGQARMDAVDECLRYGLVGIENAAVGEKPFEVTMRDSKHGKCLDDKSMEALTDTQLCIELAVRIRALSQVAPKHVGG